MYDLTVELSEREERDLATERQEEIAAICWQECPDCRGRGYTVEHMEADDKGPDYVIRPGCQTCLRSGQIQLHNPVIVEALYTVADEMMEDFGVWCYTRIAAGLSLAINDRVSSDCETVKATHTDKEYHIGSDGCDCMDAYYKAPKIDHIPHCKHYIAVLLTREAEKMIDDGIPGN